MFSGNKLRIYDYIPDNRIFSTRGTDFMNKVLCAQVKSICVKFNAHNHYTEGSFTN
jgi:hypothetical protein